VQRIQHRQKALAGNAEGVRHSLRKQIGDEDLAAGS
jgi:hypothetical protein